VIPFLVNCQKPSWPPAVLRRHSNYTGSPSRQLSFTKLELCSVPQAVPLSRRAGQGAQEGRDAVGGAARVVRARNEQEPSRNATGRIGCQSACPPQAKQTRADRRPLAACVSLRRHGGNVSVGALTHGLTDAASLAAAFMRSAKTVLADLWFATGLGRARAPTLHNLPPCECFRDVIQP